MENCIVNSNKECSVGMEAVKGTMSRCCFWFAIYKTILFTVHQDTVLEVVLAQVIIFNLVLQVHPGYGFLSENSKFVARLVNSSINDFLFKMKNNEKFNSVYYCSI